MTIEIIYLFPRKNKSHSWTQYVFCQICCMMVNVFFIIQYQSMSQHQHTPLKESQKQPQSNQDRYKQQNNDKKGFFKFIYFHVLYLMIIAFLIWKIADTKIKEQSIVKLLAQKRTIADTDKKVIVDLEDELTKLKKANQQNNNQVKSKIRATLQETTKIYEKMMEKYHMKKIEYIKERSKQQWGTIRDVPKAKESLLLAISNFNLEHLNIQIKQEVDQLLTNQYQRLSKVYNFSLPQLPFCVVVPTINNNQNFRNIYNLRSILRQNYTNFKAVIIDDASNDNNFQTLEQYVKQNPSPQKVFLIKNNKKYGALFNIHQAATKYCSPQDILLIVDGDDELLGVNVFKTLNSLYTTKQLQVLYSNFIVLYHKKNQVKGGWSSGYSDEQKKRNMYREQSTKMFPVRTFKVSTFLKIDEKNFKYDDGRWFQSASDQTYCPQVLELSCGKNEYVDEYFYLVNKQLGSNDMDVDPNLNFGIMNIVRARNKYQCHK